MRSKLWLVFLVALLLTWFAMVAVSFAAPQAPLPPQAPPARTVAWAWTVAETKAGCDCDCGKQCVCDNVCDCEGAKAAVVVKRRCCTCLTEGTFCTCPSGECACGRWENHHGKLHESHRPGVSAAQSVISGRVQGGPVTFGAFHGGTPFAGPPSHFAPMMQQSFAPSFSGGGYSSTPSFSGGGYSSTPSFGGGYSGGGGGGSC